MPALYSTVLVNEPDYGERVVRVHGGLHHAGVSQTEGADLVSGERLRMPISTAWDQTTERHVRIAEHGWSWHPIQLREAEKRAGLPVSSLPAYSDNNRTDLWIDQRMRSPAFIALLTILTDHPEIVFQEVDWRHWIHNENPREYPYREDSPILKEPKQSGVTGGGRHTPYPLGGSGDMERYAAYLLRRLGPPSSPAVIQADHVYESLSEAVIEDLRDDYERDLEWQRRDRLHGRLNHGPADMPVVRSFEQLQALVRWTPEVLDELDELHLQTNARLDEETAPYRPQGVALALF